MKKAFLKKGIGLVEVVVAAAVFSVILFTLVTASNLYLSSANSNLQLVKATYLTQEGIEAVKTIRDSGWANIIVLATSTATTSRDYYLVFSTTTSQWQATTSSSYKNIGSFTRSFNLGNVARGTSPLYKILPDMTNDQNSDTKLLIVNTSWQDKGNTITKTISTYITNILN